MRTDASSWDGPRRNAHRLRAKRTRCDGVKFLWREGRVCSLRQSKTGDGGVGVEGSPFDVVGEAS